MPDSLSLPADGWLPYDDAPARALAGAEGVVDRAPPDPHECGTCRGNGWCCEDCDGTGRIAPPVASGPAPVVEALVVDRNANVSSIADEELLRRAVRGARCRSYRKGFKHSRWVAVADAFVLGSTFAAQLCRRFGLDPDEQVRR